MINAGYDGKAFTASLGYFRDACSNLAMMRMVNGTTVSIRHTSGLRANMDELIATFETLKNSWSTLTDVIETLESTEVRMTEFLDSIYGRPTDDSWIVPLAARRFVR